MKTKAKKAKAEPETVVCVARTVVQIHQAVWRNNRSSLFGFWQGGGDFHETTNGVSGTFGTTVPEGSFVVHAKWKGRDGSQQSSSFTIRARDMVSAIVEAIGNGDVEERAGGDARTSRRPEPKGATR